MALPDPRAGRNIYELNARTREALATANDHLDDTRECQSDQRERFAKGAR